MYQKKRKLDEMYNSCPAWLKPAVDKFNNFVNSEQNILDKKYNKIGTEPITAFSYLPVLSNLGSKFDKKLNSYLMYYHFSHENVVWEGIEFEIYWDGKDLKVNNKLVIKNERDLYSLLSKILYSVNIDVETLCDYTFGCSLESVNELDESITKQDILNYHKDLFKAVNRVKQFLMK